MSVETKIKQLGLVLPAAVKLPAGLVVPISLVKVRGNMAHVSGHLAQNPDGSLMEPFGRVGAEVTLEQGIEAARVAGLSLKSAPSSYRPGPGVPDRPVSGAKGVLGIGKGRHPPLLYRVRCSGLL